MLDFLSLMLFIACSAAGPLQNDYVYDETSGYSLPPPLSLQAFK